MMYRILALTLLLSIFSCGDDDTPTPSIVNEIPPTYAFERNGQSTVSFSGQTTRIRMGEELISGLIDFNSTESQLIEMYRNETSGGGDANPFADPELNNSTKSIRNKTASSSDYFASNTTEGIEIKTQFETWISAQVSEIFPNRNNLASEGVAGQIADGSATRYVNAQGLEFNQLVNKSLIGALMTDQMLNNYLSTSVLDAGSNVENNDNGTVESDRNYTTMEHKWDEAYGYLYGTSANIEEPNLTIGADDNFLNKYVGRVEKDPDFTGIADEIYEAFLIGRAAIVAGEYSIRDDMADIIKERISMIIAIRAVYYLQQGKLAWENQNFGTAFHDLSEGYGFIYSLRFTRMPGSEQPYFSKSEVDGFLDNLMNDGPNGLWNVTPETLDNVSESIAEKFDFTVAQAGS
jgi:hypothetical protein